MIFGQHSFGGLLLRLLPIELAALPEGHNNPRVYVFRQARLGRWLISYSPEGFKVTCMSLAPMLQGAG